MPEPSSSNFPSSRRPPERSLPTAAIAIAAAVVLVVVATLVLLGRHGQVDNPNQPLPPAPYASSLALSQLAMSESISISGGKSTFLDGRVTNKGSGTVTAITVQVFFSNAEGMPPHVETLPLSLIRTREPYVDTQPIVAAPLAPGDERDFRLIFESIPANWNTQLPEVHIVRVALR